MNIWWHHTKRITKHVGKKTGHFLFPYIWHYYTDTYKGRFHHLIVDSILSMMILTLVAINAAMIGWLYIFFVPPQLDVKLSTPAVIISGTDLPLEVTYHNVGKGIANVSMQLIAPVGYTTPQTNFHFESLSENQQGHINIPGQFTGNVGENYRFILIYDYYHYGQHYQHFSTVQFSVATSSFEIVPNVPEKILHDEPVTWTVEYTNSSDYSRQDACVQLHIPEAFLLEHTSHEIDGAGVIQLGDLPARSSGIIELTGTFSNAIGEGKHVIKVLALDRCSAENYTQANIETSINVLTPRLSISTSGATIVDVGSSYRYTQSYTNTGDAPLRNATIVAQLVDFSGKYSALTATQGSVVGNTVSWIDPVLLPGETHTRAFSVTIDPNLRQKNASMSYTVSASADIDDLGISTYTRSVANAIKLNSTLQFSVVQRYSSTTGEQFGYGPYPLEADNITALRIFWEVQDFTNDLTNLTIQTTLPSQVEWTDHSAVTEGSAMSYDSTSRTVTWHTGQVTSFDHAQGASFELRVRPNTLQIGKKINVINETRFSARDSFTDVVISRSVGALRTEQPIVASTN